MKETQMPPAYVSNLVANSGYWDRNKVGVEFSIFMYCYKLRLNNANQAAIVCTHNASVP